MSDWVTRPVRLEVMEYISGLPSAASEALLPVFTGCAIEHCFHPRRDTLFGVKLRITSINKKRCLLSLCAENDKLKFIRRKNDGPGECTWTLSVDILEKLLEE